MTSVKSLKFSPKTAAITLNVSELDGRKVQAVYALLGGYNEVGRNVDLDEFKELQKQFNDILDTLASKI